MVMSNLVKVGLIVKIVQGRSKYFTQIGVVICLGQRFSGKLAKGFWVPWVVDVSVLVPCGPVRVVGIVIVGVFHVSHVESASGTATGWISGEALVAHRTNLSGCHCG